MRLLNALRSRPGKLQRLEAARGFAAFYVVLHHAGLFLRSKLHVLVSFGQEAVMLFFLLSGFVIYYSTFASGKPLVFRTYFLRRFKRIFPLFLLALALAYTAVSFQHGAWQSISWSQLLGNIAMLQDNGGLKPGVWVETFSGNSAVWSLSYEWWFYMMFVPMIYLFSARHWLQPWIVFSTSLGTTALYEAVPNQVCLFLSYFFIWWVGVELAREFIENHSVTIRTQARTIVMLFVLTCAWGLPVLYVLLHGHHLLWGVAPVLQFRHFGAALIILLASFAWSRVGWRGFRWTVQPFVLLAPVSYAIYIFHLPLLAAMSRLIPNHPYIRLACVLIILLPLAAVVELVLQPKINAWLDRRMPAPAIPVPAVGQKVVP